MSMPAPFAACQIVVPSGTVSSRPSIVRLTVRTSVGAGVAMAMSVRLPQAEILDLAMFEQARGLQSARLVVLLDHGVEPLTGERGCTPGADLERFVEEAV